jgi:hypothetical protein
MREKAAAALRAFADELRANVRNLRRTPWVKETPQGTDAVRDIEGLVTMAADFAKDVAGDVGPVETSILMKMIGLAGKADAMVAGWGPGAPITSLGAAANRLKSSAVSMGISF